MLDKSDQELVVISLAADVEGVLRFEVSCGESHPVSAAAVPGVEASARGQVKDEDSSQTLGERARRSG